MTDTMRYFRVEARELLDALMSGVLELERSGPGPEVISALMRAAHTLKGAARVVRHPEIAEVAHELEDELTTLREGDAPVPRELIDRLLHRVDLLSEKVHGLEAPPGGTPGPAPEAPEGMDTAEALGALGQTVRVDVRAIDSLLESISDLESAVSRVGRFAVDLGRVQRLAAWLEERLVRPVAAGGGGGLVGQARLHDAAEEVSATVADLRRSLQTMTTTAGGELGRLREDVAGLRLVPVATMFPVLERAVRDAAVESDRRASLVVAGGEHRVDGEVLSRLREALLHLVRNAVGHGLEPEQARIAAGKPPSGEVRVEARREGERVVLCVSDDGRGIDFAAVRRAAGLAGTTENAEDPSELLFLPGVSTASGVTSLSGRGVGLDVVARSVHEMGGGVRVSSERGRGARFELIVPLSISSLTAMLVEVRDLLVAVPLDAVKRALHRRREEHPAQQGSVSIGRTVIPVVPLSRLWGGEDPKPHPLETLLVVEAEGRPVALLIERLLGLRHLVLHPPPELLGDAPVMGAALDADGTPIPVLEPRALVRRALAATPTAAARPERQAPFVLVVDDSLTTRMLERSILESAGYRVDLADSAEEALAMAARRCYDLFLVDVEMPGMDGFSLVETTRADPELRRTPAIIVSSRASQEDRARAEQAGASGYVVKGEFDQERLLAMIAALTGGAA